MMDKKFELLAPAGSLETCKAVVLAGADAVYLGGEKFGARAYANNFTKEELLEAIDFAHLHQAAIHLTVNTLLKQKEFDELYDYIVPYYERGLDAVIVQDLGVLQFLHHCFPKLSMHASTQMSVAGAYGAEYLYSLGAERIVLARELSLNEIAFLHNQVPEVELEVFIHGALCYCYSGQCFMSSMLGGRSGNRGRCAGTCRLPYEVQDASHRTVMEGKQYPLSLKDLCTVDMLPELADIGVHSFKIEGRMKSTEYAAGVVSVYRKYLDAYRNGRRTSVSKNDYQKLLDTGNRSGFTDGYYRRKNGKEMVSFERPSHVKNESGLHALPSGRMGENARKLPVRGEAVLQVGQPAEFTVAYHEKKGAAIGEAVQAAQNSPTDRESAASQLSKLGNTPFFMDQLMIDMDAPVFLPKQQLNRLRREAVCDLIEQILSPMQRQAEFSDKESQEYLKQKSLPDMQPDATGEPPIYVLVETSQQLRAVLDYPFVSRVYLSSIKYGTGTMLSELREDLAAVHARGKEAYYVFPPIFRKRTSEEYTSAVSLMLDFGIDGFLLKSIDELGFMQRLLKDVSCCVIDYNVYTWSDYTKKCLADGLFVWDTVPIELNRKELLHRDNRLSELIVYGSLPLMTSAQCIHANTGHCDKKGSLNFLKDRYRKIFPVKNACTDCYNIIYNSQPLSLLQLAKELQQLNPAAFRLQFSIESGEQTVQVLDCCKEALLDKKVPDLDFLPHGYTNGHYKRGVE